jgi:hypothetical protein
LSYLTTAQFQALIQDVVAHFSSDWSDHRTSEPALFPAAQSDVVWWEAFSEFAHAEILNARIHGAGRPDDEKGAA